MPQQGSKKPDKTAEIAGSPCIHLRKIRFWLYPAGQRHVATSRIHP
jgi:hypothetical protein